MARIVFISPYLKGEKNAARLANRTRYVATRDGVELLKDNAAALPETKKQHDYILRLLRSFPEAKELAEYEEYVSSPSQQNASALIGQMQEQVVAMLDGRENFVDYIANRPGAQLRGEHGLWDADGKVPVLQKAIDEVANHKGTVWTPIISLPREEAERLGYDNAENWQALINASICDIAQGYKIAPEHLRWYAALHEKEKHVHVHMIVFSKDPKEGYLTTQGIRQIKSAFAKQIYRQDRINIYERQTQYRDALQRDAESLMSSYIRQMEEGTISSPKLALLVSELSERLKNCSGKKVYGYLPPAVKRIVDEIVDELAADERVAAAYSLWQEMREEVCALYSNTPPEKLPLSRQKEFKPVRNMVIREVLKMDMAHAVEAAPEQREESGLPQLTAPPQNGSAPASVEDEQSPDITPSAAACVIRMLHHMGGIFRDSCGTETFYTGLRIDRKRRKQLQEKRLAMGHKADDHEGFEMQQQ